MNRTPHTRRMTGGLRALAVLGVTGLAVAGCSAGGGSEPTPEEPVEITYWTWGAEAQATVDLFEEAHPEIDVKVENVGVGADQYTKMQNAIDAGSGGPDVAQATYDAIPNFALTGALADVTQHGGEELRDIILPGVLSLVSQGDAIYAVPQDFGPGVMFYREDIFEEAGVDVPATWDEYAEAAEEIAASGDDRHITFIDPALYDAAYMGLWQLDADPWSVEGESNLTLNLDSDEATQWADYWTQLNNDDLLIESTMGSDEWFRQLNDGQIASWIVGAWGLQALSGVVPEGSGLWRVAPMPVWEEGSQASSQFGGGGTVVLEQSDQKEAATTFAMWMNTSDEGVESLKNDQALLPTTIAAWEDPEFLEEEFEYLGGQQARQVFAESAENTVVGWQWLPIQTYVSSIYGDTVGQAIANQSSIADGLEAWEERIAEYATEQGFTVE